MITYFKGKVAPGTYEAPFCERVGVWRYIFVLLISALGEWTIFFAVGGKSP
jgi:hypothetical protein